MVRARLLAAVTHLAVSATVAVGLIVLVTQVWYPSPLFSLAKGRDIFFIVVYCDITLGPLMTLVIFNVRKPKSELVRDLVIIAAIQLAAMTYGVFNLLSVRPAYIVYNVGQFNVPLASELVGGDGKNPGSSEKPPAPWFGPKLVGSKLPEDAKEHNDLVFSAVSGRGDVFQMPRYFVSYDEVRGEVAKRAETVAKIAARFHVSQAAIEKAMGSYRSKQIEFGLLPLVIRTTTALAVVDTKTGDFLGIEPIPIDE